MQTYKVTWKSWCKTYTKTLIHAARDKETAILTAERYWLRTIPEGMRAMFQEGQITAEVESATTDNTAGL